MLLPHLLAPVAHCEFSESDCVFVKSGDVMCVVHDCIIGCFLLKRNFVYHVLHRLCKECQHASNAPGVPNHDWRVRPRKTSSSLGPCKEHPEVL